RAPAGGGAGRGVPSPPRARRGAGGGGSRARGAGPLRQSSAAPPRPPRARALLRPSPPPRDRARHHDPAQAPAPRPAPPRHEPRRDARADGPRQGAARARHHDRPDRAQARRGHGHVGSGHRARPWREDRGRRACRGAERRAGDRGLPRPATSGGMSARGPLLIDFRGVHTHYRPLHVLKGVSYDIYEGEIVSLLGGNASGKSTTMKTVLGLVRPTEGTIRFRGEPIHALRTSEIVKRGIAPVPEGRRVFPRMTIIENLE